MSSRRRRGPKRPPGGTRALVLAQYERGIRPSEIASRLGVTKSTVAFHLRRLEVNPDERFARRYDWSEIQRVYDTGLSVRQCAKRFGFNLASWHQAAQRGDVVARPRAMPIEQLLVVGRRKTNRHHLKTRLLQEGLKENRCEQCGITTWQGKPLSMQLHHANGNGSDNRLENIIFLCGNCHSQTDTYGAKNGRRRVRRAQDSAPTDGPRRARGPKTTR